MSLWRRLRYYCANVQGGCIYARKDTPFTKREFDTFEGLCRGHRKVGCGSPLKLGDPEDLRARWLASLAVLAVVALGLAWIARTFLFPPPLDHIAFATTETTTDDQVGLASLEIVRSGDLNRRARVEIASEDGTAKAGEDYGALRRELVFEPGERTKTIQLAVLPDRTFEKAVRYFSLALLNVAGEPHHIVRIAPRQVPHGEELEAEQSVMAASRIAADIAGFMVKRGVLLDLLTERRMFRDEVAEYKQQLISNQDNLSRARESYAEAMRTLQTHQATLVMHTIDRIRDDLVKKQFGQQARAIAIMKGQFTELANRQSMDMDRWVSELEAAVPRPGEPKPKTTI
jgi:chorismate mutase